MMVIEIEEDDLMELSENAEKMLRYGGKMMHCIDRIKEGCEDGDERYGRRGNMGHRYGRREEGGEPDTPDNTGTMGNRRGRDAYGRYV